ncbi:glycosyltransferase family 39 protein [Candidatus Saccharibacteria bacterium]|nr:glycosyltransferase family 39 protein [Candidatus Saccharibacteria bacterium]
MKDFLLKRKRVFIILTPALLGMLYMILCFVNIRQSIWFDESFSAYLTRFDLKSIWEFTAADVHPPLYYFTLKAWAHLFGHVDFAMRMLSVVFGALAILFAFLWLKYKYGLKAAMIAGFLLSISPVFIRYGQEMRMYTMVAAIVFAATYFLQLAIDNKQKKWWIIYAILVALGMWTHYFAFFAWCAHLVYLFVTYGKSFWKKKLWMPYLLAILLYLPWMPSMFAQIQNVQQNGFWISSVSVVTMADYFSEDLYYTMAYEVQNWILVLATVTVSAILFVAVRYHKQMVMLLSMALVPLASLVALSLPPLSPMFIPRYIMYAMMAIPMVAGVGISMLTNELALNKRKKMHFIQRPGLIGACFILIVGGSSIIGIANVYAKGNYNVYNDTKSASKDLYNLIIDLDNGHNLPIISSSQWLYYDLSAYTSEEHPILFLDEQTDYKYGSTVPLKQSYFGRIDNLDAWLEKHDGFWYVGTAPENPYENQLEFPREGWRVTEITNQRFNDKSDTYQILKLERE